MRIFKPNLHEELAIQEALEHVELIGIKDVVIEVCVAPDPPHHHNAAASG